jgi:hypothetical protein
MYTRDFSDKQFVSRLFRKKSLWDAELNKPPSINCGENTGFLLSQE